MKHTLNIVLLLILSGCNFLLNPPHNEMNFNELTEGDYWVSHHIKDIQLISENGYFGFIDSLGTILCTPKYDRIFSFHDELAIVTLDNKYGVLSKNGELIVHAEYDYISDFNDGVALFYKNEEWNWMDRQGNVLIPFDNYYVKSQNKFSDYVLIKENEKYSFGIITSRMSIPRENHIMYDWFWDQVLKDRFDEYFYRPRIKNRGFPFWNQRYWYPLFFFHEGLSFIPKIVEDKVKLGLIDDDGQEVLPFIFENAQHFSNGKACVKINGKWGVINKKGEWLINPKYTYLELTPEKYYIYYDGNRYGIIDESENVVIPPDYLVIGHLFGDVFALLTPENNTNKRVITGPDLDIQTWGAINISTGDTVLPFAYHWVESINETIAVGVNYFFRQNFLFKRNDSLLIEELNRTMSQPPYSKIYFQGKGVLTLFNNKNTLGVYETDFVDFVGFARGLNEVRFSDVMLSILPYSKVDDFYNINGTFIDFKGREVSDQILLKHLHLLSNKTKLVKFEDSNLFGCKDLNENIILEAQFDKLNIGPTGIIAKKNDYWFFFDLMGEFMFQYDCDYLEETHTGVLQVTKGNESFLINKNGDKLLN